ncbi:MAG: PIN domain-containing protein [Acidobacteriota bacterium]
MREFFDTSVLIGAFWRGHPHHDASLKLVSGATKRTSACAAHTLAEVYATMTALPVKDVIPPDQAMLFVQEARDRCSIVTLTEDEYYATIEHAAELGFTSGRVYDALLLRCATKVKSETIYTWNLKHFRVISPDTADRMRTP